MGNPSRRTAKKCVPKEELVSNPPESHDSLDTPEEIKEANRKNTREAAERLKGDSPNSPGASGRPSVEDRVGDSNAPAPAEKDNKR